MSTTDTATQTSAAATDAAADQTQSQAEKTFTQAELNAILAKTKTQLERKFTERYQELGDPDELRDIVQQHRQQTQEQEIRKGNFEKLLQEMASKKDAEIVKRDQIISEFRIEQPLVDASARLRSINPEQVKQLLKPSLRLNSDGAVEVIDSKGNVRYNDSGHALQVEDLVREFLDANPHFVAAGATSTQTSGNTASNHQAKLDIKDLDMTRPEHRRIFAQARREGKI